MLGVQKINPQKILGELKDKSTERISTQAKARVLGLEQKTSYTFRIAQ